MSEPGPAIWPDPSPLAPRGGPAPAPRRAARLPRRQHHLAVLCTPDLDGEPVGDRLRRDQFGVYRVRSGRTSQTVEFHLGHGDWIRLLVANHFQVEDLIEVRPPTGATSSYDTVTTPQWPARWPCEEVWVARRGGLLQRPPG